MALPAGSFELMEARQVAPVRHDTFDTGDITDDVEQDGVVADARRPDPRANSGTQAVDQRLFADQRALAAAAAHAGAVVSVRAAG